jgi:hypothetical protein
MGGSLPVAKYVANIASAYTVYEDRIAKGGITEEFLISISLDGVEKLLTDLEITDWVHRSVLKFHFQKLFPVSEVCVDEDSKKRRKRRQMLKSESKRNVDEETPPGRRKKAKEQRGSSSRKIMKGTIDWKKPCDICGQKVKGNNGDCYFCEECSLCGVRQRTWKDGKFRCVYCRVADDVSWDTFKTDF